MKNNKNFTVVSDAGIDDLIALALLNKLTCTGKNTIISSFGNVPVKYTTKNIGEYIENFARKWSYKIGSSKPVKKLDRPWPYYFHGPDGTWKVHPMGENKIIEDKLAKIYNNFISLAPMTEIAKFLDKSEIKNITIMGGTFNLPGNETEYAETNIAFDPEAADRFFDNCKKITVKVIPLDVTKKVFWTKKIVEKIPEISKENIWAKKLLIAWFENYGDKNKMNFDLHDPLAVYSIFFSENIEWKNSGVETIINGVKRGQTVFNKNNPTCSVAIGIKNHKEVADHIFEIIFKN